MTKDEFKRIAKALKSAYRQSDFLANNDSLSTWYDMLKDISYEDAGSIVVNHIRTSVYPPTIADILMAHKAKQDEISEYKNQLRELYEYTKGVYPSSEDTKTARVTWSKIVNADSWMARIGKAKILRDATIRFVEESEMSGTVNNIPTFEEYLKGKMA